MRFVGIRRDGGPVEVAGVLLAAGLGQWVRRFFLHRKVNQFAVTMVAAAVACVVYLGFVAGLDVTTGGGGPGHQAGYISAVLFLVPGFALVTGALEYARENNLTADDMLVVILPDHGSRYLAKLYNDDWMRAQEYMD